MRGGWSPLLQTSCPAFCQQALPALVQEKRAAGRPRLPLLAMKCSRGAGLQGRKSGAIRKKLQALGQRLQALVAEQLYATTPDK